MIALLSNRLTLINRPRYESPHRQLKTGRNDRKKFRQCKRIFSPEEKGPASPVILKLARQVLVVLTGPQGVVHCQPKRG